MRHIIPILTFLVAAHGALAAQPELPSCPPPMEFATRKAELMAELKETRSAADGLYLTRYLAEIFATAPNRAAQDMLSQAMTRRQQDDLAGATAALDGLIAYCPAFAEGYHQRAMIRRARGDLAGALADLDLALDRAPDHLGAMASKAQVLVELGRFADGRAQRDAVLRMNPWMPERFVDLDIPGVAL